MSSDNAGPTTEVSGDLLTESARFAWDTFFDQADYAEAYELPTGDAVDRGWQPLALAATPDSPGVQIVTVPIVVRCRQKIPAGQEPSAAPIRLPELGRGYQPSASHH
jgi:hypothetical protein